MRIRFTYLLRLFVFFLTLSSMGVAIGHELKENEIEKTEEVQQELEWYQKNDQSPASRRGLVPRYITDHSGNLFDYIHTTTTPRLIRKYLMHCQWIHYQ